MSASVDPLLLLFCHWLPDLGSIDAFPCPVGSHCWCPWFHRLLHVSCIPGVDHTVQSVCSSTVRVDTGYNPEILFTLHLSAYRYIQLSGMTFGGWIEADRRLRAYEFYARRERKRQNDEAVWKHWEGMIEQQERRQQEQNQEKG